MSDPWISAFASAPHRHLDDGAPLFLRNGPVREAYLVRRGAVRLTRSLSDGAALCLHVARAGDLVAAASLFSPNYHCDAQAEGPTEVSVLPRATLLRHLEDKGAAIAALAETAHQVQALRARIEILRLRRVADRLDAYLALHGPPDPGGWAAVADWIGVSAPALYRERARRA